MTRDKRIEILEKEEYPMSNIQAATLLTRLHADYTARLKYNNLVPDPAYAEAVAIAIMSLREE